MKDLKKPPWLKKRISFYEDILKVKLIPERLAFRTVREEAHYPNIEECFSSGTGTIFILRRICTHNCGMCSGT